MHFTNGYTCLTKSYRCMKSLETLHKIICGFFCFLTCSLNELCNSPCGTFSSSLITHHWGVNASPASNANLSQQSAIRSNQHHRLASLALLRVRILIIAGRSAPILSAPSDTSVSCYANLNGQQKYPAPLQRKPLGVIHTRIQREIPRRPQSILAIKPLHPHETMQVTLTTWIAAAGAVFLAFIGKWSILYQSPPVLYLRGVSPALSLCKLALQSFPLSPHQTKPIRLCLHRFLFV